MTKEVLKMALEALEDLGMKHYESTGEVLYKETFTAIKEALAQPEQEPVGDFYITKDMAEHIKNLEVDWTICASGSKRPTEKKVVPVFVGNTTPLQRKPLTEQEIGAILEDINAFGTRLYTFARAIEATHGIKEQK